MTANLCSAFVISSLILVAGCAGEIIFDQPERYYLPGPASFGFEITNPYAEAVSLRVEAVSYPKVAPDYVDSFVEDWEINLRPGESRRLWLNFTVYDTTLSGEHTVSVEVSGDYDDYGELDFNVFETLKLFDSHLAACTGPCDSYSTVFLPADSPITIRALNDVGAMVYGTIQSPSGRTEQLMFTGNRAFLDLEGYGEYIITAVASKKGYADVDMELQITSLEKLPDIIEDIPCNGDGVCNGMETRQTCPQDCLPEEVGEQVQEGVEEEREDLGREDEAENEGGTELWHILVIAAVVSIIAIYLKRKKKDGKRS